MDSIYFNIFAFLIPDIIEYQQFRLMLSVFGLILGITIIVTFIKAIYFVFKEGSPKAKMKKSFLYLVVALIVTCFLIIINTHLNYYGSISASTPVIESSASNPFGQ